MVQDPRSARRRTALAAIARREWLLRCLALAATACRRRTGDPAYARGNNLVVAVRDLSAFKPDETDADFLVFLSLLERDRRHQYVPRLAAAWQHSADYREWTYQLRRDVRWHDGRPVTAHDVKFTFDLLRHPDVAEYTQVAEVVDDFTVRISGQSGYQDDVVFYPKHLIEGLEPRRFYEWEFWTRPVGNGPYRFRQYIPETMIEFEANPEFYKGRPKIERVTLKFAGDTGLTELLAGNVDFVLEADPAQVPRLADDPRFRVYHYISPGARAIFWKCDHPLFRDARVRRALTMAIDRRELLRAINLPQDVPITDGVLTLPQLLRRQWRAPLPYDPVQAHALLAAAGWRDLDGDGVIEQAGRPFRFRATTRNRDGLDRLAVYVQAQLRRIGVVMDIESVEDSGGWDRLKSGNFEALFWIHQAQTRAVQRDFGAGNRIGYADPGAHRIINALDTADPDERDRLYRELSDVFRDDQPFTRLVPWTQTFFAHRRVRGLETMFRTDPTRYAEEVWLDEREAPA